MPSGRGGGGGFGRGGRRGLGGGFGFGPGGECVCPNCNYHEVHELNVPCYTKKCPRCDTPLTRKS
jgi:hypothetical protein